MQEGKIKSNTRDRIGLGEDLDLAILHKIINII